MCSGATGRERITGHLRHEVVGHSCIGEAVLHCDQPGCEFCNEDCPLARAIKTSQPAETIGFLQHKAGHEIPVRLRAVPVHNQHGSIIGAAETFEEMQPDIRRDRREDTQRLPYSDDVTGVASQVLMRSYLRQTLATFVEVQVSVQHSLFAARRAAAFSCQPGTSGSFVSAASSSAFPGRLSLDNRRRIGRWNDDQFLVILNACREEALHAVRERVRRMLANDGIEWWGERRSLPISIGEATAQPDDTIESLIERAQKSLAAAAAGRIRPAPALRDASGS